MPSAILALCASIHFFMRPPKTLIRLGGCPECPESSLKMFCFVLSEKVLRSYFLIFAFSSSIGPTLAFLTSLPVQDGGPHDTKMAAPPTSDPRWRPPRHQDGGPHDFRSKMAAPTTSGPRWRPPRHQDGGPHEVRYEMAAPVTRSVTPRRVSQRPRPREGSVKS